MRITIKFIAVLLILTLALTMGCSAAQKPVPKNIVSDDKMDNSNNPGGNPDEVARESENLRQQVKSINGVGDAAVVINNSRVIVGVTPSQNYNGDPQVLVANIHANINNGSANRQEVYVTAEPMLFKQIRDIENRINNGKRPETYAKDLNNIAEIIRANDSSKAIER
jgi:YhcN/YlaJ family sporulation lipoprotein